MNQLHEVLAQIAAFAQRLPSEEAAALKDTLQQATGFLHGHAGNLNSPGLSEAIAMLANAHQQQTEVQGKIEGARQRITRNPQHPRFRNHQ